MALLALKQARKARRHLGPKLQPRRGSPAGKPGPLPVSRRQQLQKEAQRQPDTLPNLGRKVASLAALQPATRRPLER